MSLSEKITSCCVKMLMVQKITQIFNLNKSVNTTLQVEVILQIYYKVLNVSKVKVLKLNVPDLMSNNAS